MRRNKAPSAQQPVLYSTYAALLALGLTVVLISGCAVDEVCLLSYTSSAEVKPSAGPSSPVVGSSPFPWDVVLSGASDILTGARKKALEQKVGYRESRSIALFRIRRAENSPRNPGEPARSQGKSSQEKPR